MKEASGLKLLLRVGDGASPEVFTALCTVNAQRGITFSSKLNDFLKPNCTSPEEIAWIVREKDGLEVAFTGGGMLHTPDVSTMYDWQTSSEPKNCQVVIDVPSVDGGVVFEGAFHCGQFEITGNRGAKMEATMALASSGEVTKSANS